MGAVIEGGKGNRKGSEQPGKTSADSAPGAGHIDGYANL